MQRQRPSELKSKGTQSATKGVNMAAKPANAAQKQWMSDIAGWAVENIGFLYGQEYNGALVQLHHVLGRSAKHNKIAIGHWFILPVPYELHDVSGNSIFNVTHHKHSFTNKFGNQRDLFGKMISDMGNAMDGHQTPPFNVVLSIMDTTA